MSEDCVGDPPEGYSFLELLRRCRAAKRSREETWKRIRAQQAQTTLPLESKR